MSRFSQAEAEARGWSIVHQRGEYKTHAGPGLEETHPATIVAEKYHSPPGQRGSLIHEEAPTIGLLLERINLWEQQYGNVQEAEEYPVDTSGELKVFSPLYDAEADDEGEPARGVVIPTEPGDLSLEAPVKTITDAEWSARSRADVLVIRGEDGERKQVTYSGAGEEIASAEELRALNKKAIEDRRAAEAAVGPTEQVEFDTVGIVDTPGIGAGGVLVVREGEDPSTVSERKEQLKKMREEGRVGSMELTGHEAVAPEGADKLAGLDVGIQERGDLSSELPRQGRVERILEEPEGEIEEAPPAPHLYPEGVEPQVDLDEIPEEPASAVEADARQEAEEDAALEQRDEGLVEAESDESKNEVREAGIDAAAEATEELKENPDPNADSDEEKQAEVDATDSAKELAAEHEVDLSEVKGTGKDGRITKPDVEAALPDSE
jgi:pyruvate/2-oxoglutarate dehydrogenase complex dihydrolipoamide acyltransferase (E2) component